MDIIMLDRPNTHNMPHHLFALEKYEEFYIWSPLEDVTVSKIHSSYKAGEYADYFLVEHPEYNVSYVEIKHDRCDTCWIIPYDMLPKAVKHKLEREKWNS